MPRYPSFSFKERGIGGELNSRKLEGSSKLKVESLNRPSTTRGYSPLLCNKGIIRGLRLISSENKGL
jgi:hypothetical protein